jgi:hypothetical protein
MEEIAFAPATLVSALGMSFNETRIVNGRQAWKRYRRWGTRKTTPPGTPLSHPQLLHLFASDLTVPLPPLTPTFTRPLGRVIHRRAMRQHQTTGGRMAGAEPSRAAACNPQEENNHESISRLLAR